jgi:hypothetical protein
VLKLKRIVTHSHISHFNFTQFQKLDISHIQVFIFTSNIAAFDVDSLAVGPSGESEL